MFKKILCPIDLGELTEKQLNFARGFARSQKAKLGALYVIPIFTDLYGGISSGQLQQQWDVYSHEKVLEYCRDDIEPHLWHGGTVDEIVQLADIGKSDLIMMPTHGYRGIKKFFLGSVFQGVLRETNRPVLALPPHFLERSDGKFESPKAILCAVDVQEGSSDLIAVSEKLAEEYKSNFSVIHSFNIEEDVVRALVPPTIQENVKSRIVGMHPTVEASKIVIRKGAAHDQITKYALEHDIDFVVLGFSKSSKLKLRTTLYRTIVQVTVPVLCFPIGE